MRDVRPPLPILLVLLLACAPASAQDLRGLAGHYGVKPKGQAGNGQLPAGQTGLKDAIKDALKKGKLKGLSQGTVGVLAGDRVLGFEGCLQELGSLGVLQPHQAQALRRLHGVSPRATTEIVGEIRRFAATVRTPEAAAHYARSFGSARLGARARTLFLQGAQKVLARMGRTRSAGQGWGLQTQNIGSWTGHSSSASEALSRYGDLSSGRLILPLGELVLSVGGRGSWSVSDRSGSVEVMTVTDPLYLTRDDVVNHRRARVWKSTMCAYHFKGRDVTLIGRANGPTAITRQLMVSNGLRLLLIDGVDGPVSTLQIQELPLADTALALTLESPKLEHVVIDRGRIVGQRAPKGSVDAPSAAARVTCRAALMALSSGRRVAVAGRRLQHIAGRATAPVQPAALLSARVARMLVRKNLQLD